MGFPEGVNRRYGSIAAILLIVIWIWVIFDRPYKFPKHVPWNTYANTPQAPPADETVLVQDVFEYPAVDSGAIKNICSGAQWNESLVFMCDNSDGNIAQVRNSILMCVRYAITAGANIVIPRIINGDGKHAVGRVVLDWDRQPFDFMFDTEHFKNSMRQSCPEMKIYESRDRVPFPDNYVRPPVITLHPEKLEIREGEDWRTVFYSIVQDMVSPNEDTFPIVIEVGRPSPSYEIFDDGKPFASDFGKILKFPSEVRSLAQKTLDKLAQTHNYTFDEEVPIPPDTFFGVHLFTETDRLGPGEGWPAPDWDFAQYAPESKSYLDQAVQKGHKIMYAATNKRADIDNFTKDAKERQITVHSKYDLLEGDDRNKLNQLTRDQQELVDFLVLLKASDFAGIGHSSVSWNVALKRHLYAADGEFSIGSHVFEDSLSHLYGKLIDGRTLYHNMWP